MIDFKSQKGVLLLLALLILTLLLGAGLGVGTILLQETKTARNVGYSIVAFYAADAGVERVMYAIKKEGYVPEISGEEPCGLKFSCPSLGSDASYVVRVKDFTLDQQGNIQTADIASKGNYNQINRAIEINIE